MKPGATTAPLASSSRSPARLVPISAMRPSRTSTSAEWPGAPVPSITVPPRITMDDISRPPLESGQDRNPRPGLPASSPNSFGPVARVEGVQTGQREWIRACRPGFPAPSSTRARDWLRGIPCAGPGGSLLECVQACSSGGRAPGSCSRAARRCSSRLRRERMERRLSRLQVGPQDEGLGAAPPGAPQGVEGPWRWLEASPCPFSGLADAPQALSLSSSLPTLSLQAPGSPRWTQEASGGSTTSGSGCR